MNSEGWRAHGYRLDCHFHQYGSSYFSGRTSFVHSVYLCLALLSAQTVVACSFGDYADLLPLLIHSAGSDGDANALIHNHQTVCYDAHRVVNSLHLPRKTYQKSFTDSECEALRQA